MAKFYNFERRYDLRKYHLEKILLCFFISSFFGCEPHKMDNQVVCVTLGNTNLSIPNQYFLPSFPSSLVPSQGLDKNVGALLEVPLHDLGYQIKVGTGYDLDLTLLVTPLDMHHPQTRLPPTVLKAWRGYGSYKNRIIEFDNVTQLYRIYANEYRKSWQFFKTYPDGSMNYDEKWIAGCLAFSSEKKVKDLSHMGCDTTFLYKDIHIEMSFSGIYIDLIEEFKLKIRNLFNDWETETCELNGASQFGWVNITIGFINTYNRLPTFFYSIQIK
jgi:hypothetical protein